jgi:hypothetical protein
LEVHVQDPEGNTSSGIKVRITGGPSRVPDGSTDAAGIARFELQPGDYIVNAAFRAAVWEPAQVKKGSLAPGKTFVVRMKKLVSGFLAVSVHSAGTPEAGATVTVAQAVHAPQKTDADGNAFFSLLPGTYQVSAVSADGKSSGATSVTIKPEETTQADIGLQLPIGEVPPTGGA